MPLWRWEQRGFTLLPLVPCVYMCVWLCMCVPLGAVHFSWATLYWWISWCDPSECFRSCFSKYMWYQHGFFPENLRCFTMGLCLRKAVFLKGLWPAFCACATLGNLLPPQWEMGMTCQHFAAKDVCVYIFSVCVCIKWACPNSLISPFNASCIG